MIEADPLVFEPARLNLRLGDVRAAMETNQVDALGRLVHVLAGPDAMAAVYEMARQIKAKRRSHLRLIRGGKT